MPRRRRSSVAGSAASHSVNPAPDRPYAATSVPDLAEHSAFPSEWVSVTKKKVCVSGDQNEAIQAIEETAAASTSSSPSPGWALLNHTGRFSDHRNATTAECRTKKGQAVAVSFWLADPPAVSYFSVHCPFLDGLDDDDEDDEEDDQDVDFSDHMEMPSLICAEGAFVLFSVTINGSIHHFVYTARGPAGKPSLRVLPEPNPMVEAFESQQFGLLPCGDDHYAVVFLHHEWDFRDQAWHYHTYVFLSQSKTNAWKRSKEALLQLSESEQLLFDRHASYKQIAVGANSLGWVDLLRGIILVSNLFDKRPVITYISLPADKCSITDIHGSPHYAPEYFCDVTCCDGMIKFVEIEFDQPECRTNGQGWRATTWNRRVQWNDWRRRCTVDVAKISVDTSYSEMLPELMDNKKQELVLKNMYFLIPTLSMLDDDLLYMLAKIDEKDNTAWLLTIDMKHAALQALVPVSEEEFDTVKPYSLCAFPNYYLNNMTPGLLILALFSLHLLS
jgi:hypothetical protein